MRRTGGRLSNYRPEYDDQVRKLALLGLKDDQIAEIFGISVSTLTNWKKRHPTFLLSMNAGKVIADADVASALYHRAKGYSHPAVRVFFDKDNKQPIYAPYVEHHPPDTNAARYWLNNRQRARWSERQEITGADGEPLFRLRAMSDAQRYQEAMSLIQEARQALDDAKAAGLISDADYEEITDEES